MLFWKRLQDGENHESWFMDQFCTFKGWFKQLLYGRKTIGDYAPDIIPWAHLKASTDWDFRGINNSVCDMYVDSINVTWCRSRYKNVFSLHHYSCYTDAKLKMVVFMWTENNPKLRSRRECGTRCESGKEVNFMTKSFTFKPKPKTHEWGPFIIHWEKAARVH